MIEFEREQVFVLPMKECHAKLLNIFSQIILQISICIVTLLVLQISLFTINLFPVANFLVIGVFVVITPLLAVGASITVSLLVKLFITYLKIKNTLMESRLTLLVLFFHCYTLVKQPYFHLRLGVINTSFLKLFLLRQISANQ